MPSTTTTAETPGPDHRSGLDRVTQVLLPVFTVSEFALISVRLPQYSVLCSLVSIPFWFHNSWTQWVEGRRAGAMASTCVSSVFVVLGVVNYWLAR